MAHACAKIAWITLLLKELNLKPSSVPIIWTDNKSTTTITAYPIYHARTKDIEIDIHFVRNKG